MTSSSPPSKTPVSDAIVGSVENGVYWLTRNWLALFNVAVLVYVSLPFVAPVLMQVGWRTPASAIYTIYSPLCHQFGYRSWYLFGEESYYLAPDFAERTGIEPYSTMGRFEAKAFRGNAEMGWKVAYCQRDVAIYAGMFFAGVFYAIMRRRGPVRPLHFILYVLIGVGPIGLDGFSQLFSQPPFNLIPLRESTPLFRTLTGALFGIASVWLAYPYVEESMDEIKFDIEAKRGVATEPDNPAPADG